MLPHASIICCLIAIVHCSTDTKDAGRDKRDINTVDEISDTERRDLVREKLHIVGEKLNRNKTEVDWKTYEQKWNEYGKKWETYGSRRDDDRHGNRNKRELGQIGNPMYNRRNTGEELEVKARDLGLFNRNRRNEREPLGQPLWDKIRQNLKSYEQEFMEYRKKWEVSDIRSDAGLSLRISKRDDRSHIGNPIWDAIRQNANGRYGSKWDDNVSKWAEEKSIIGKRNKRDESKQSGNSKWDEVEQKWKAHGQEWKDYGKKWGEVGKKSSH